MHSSALIVDIQESEGDDAWRCALSTHYTQENSMMAHYTLRDKDPCFHKDDYISGPTEGDFTVWSSPRGSWTSREGKCNNSAMTIDCQLQSEKQDQAHLKRLRF